MSVLIVVCGSASNSSQLQTRSKPPPSCRARDQCTTSICGVGPADRMGKSVVTCWPGGTRVSGFWPRLDLKPRDFSVSSMELDSLPVDRFPGLKKRHQLSNVLKVGAKCSPVDGANCKNINIEKTGAIADARDMRPGCYVTSHSR